MLQAIKLGSVFRNNQFFFMQMADTIYLWLWHIGFSFMLIVILFHFAVVAPFLRKRGRLKALEEFSSWRIPALLMEYRRSIEEEGRSVRFAQFVWVIYLLSIVCFVLGGVTLFFIQE